MLKLPFFEPLQLVFEGNTPFSSFNIVANFVPIIDARTFLSDLVLFDIGLSLLNTCGMLGWALSADRQIWLCSRRHMVVFAMGLLC
jgi:hypothetical protein